DGVDDLGELCGERRVLRQALAARLLLGHQCLKCRRPVNSIAMWFLFAVSIIIASRSEPPGWMIAVTPARAATSMPSGNGKYASEAMTARRAFSPALRTAVSTATTRDIWPGPTPTVARPLARTIAFEVTCFTQRHANRRSVNSSSEG